MITLILFVTHLHVLTYHILSLIVNCVPQDNVTDAYQCDTS